MNGSLAIQLTNLLDKMIDQENQRRGLGFMYENVGGAMNVE
jgi:hypothetical protein